MPAPAEPNIRLKNVGVCGVADTSWNLHSSTDQPLFPRAGTACAAVAGSNPIAAAAIAMPAPNRRATLGCTACNLVGKLGMVSPQVRNVRRRPNPRKRDGEQLIHPAATEPRIRTRPTRLPRRVARGVWWRGI
jgi:hypothetical protein